MFRDNRSRGLLTAALVLITLVLLTFAAFQMGAASSASGELATPLTGRSFFFFPFFIGFGLLKFAFWLLLFMFVFRLIFRPWGRHAHAGKWRKKFQEERMTHMKEVHDRWHTESPDDESNEETPATEE